MQRLSILFETAHKNDVDNESYSASIEESARSESESFDFGEAYRADIGLGNDAGTESTDSPDIMERGDEYLRSLGPEIFAAYRIEHRSLADAAAAAAAAVTAGAGGATVHGGRCAGCAGCCVGKGVWDVMVSKRVGRKDGCGWGGGVSGAF